MSYVREAVWRKIEGLVDGWQKNLNIRKPHTANSLRNNSGAPIILCPGRACTGEVFEISFIRMNGHIEDFYNHEDYYEGVEDDKDQEEYVR